MHFKYDTKGVCSFQVEFDIDGELIKNVNFYGGCDGNLKAISTLIEGMNAQEVADRLKGNTCGRRSTSCADQLSKAILESLESMNG